MLFSNIKDLVVAVPDAAWSADPWGRGFEVLVLRADHPSVAALAKSFADRNPNRKKIADAKNRVMAEQILGKRGSDSSQALVDTMVEMVQEGKTGPDLDLARLEIASRIRDWRGLTETNAAGETVPVSFSFEVALRLLGFEGAVEIDATSAEGAATLEELSGDSVVGNRLRLALASGAAVRLDGHAKTPDGAVAFVPVEREVEFSEFDQASNSTVSKTRMEAVPHGGQPVGDAIRAWWFRASLDAAGSRAKGKEGLAQVFPATPATEPAQPERSRRTKRSA